MAKFSKQRTLSECGPRAIHNALIFHNRKIVSMERLKKECGTDRDGSSDYPVYITLRKYFSISKLSVSSLLRSKVGSSFVVGYDRLEDKQIHSGHYMLVLKTNADEFVLINYISHKNFDVVDKSCMSYFKTSHKMNSQKLKTFLKAPVIHGITEHPLIYLLK